MGNSDRGKKRRERRGREAEEADGDALRGMGPRACDLKVARLGLIHVLITKITVYRTNITGRQVGQRMTWLAYAALGAGRCEVPAHTTGFVLSRCAAPFRPFWEVASRIPRSAASPAAPHLKSRTVTHGTGR